MRAHLVQIDVAWEDKPANRAKARALIEQAGPERGDLVILPEMFDTGFSFNLAKTADADGATLAFLTDTARSLGVWVHGARTGLAADGRGRNLATIIDPSGERVCEYQKRRLFPLGAGDTEASRFEPGPHAVAYTWTREQGAPAGRAVVSPTICYDLRFPEVYLDGLSLGAEIFVVSSSWPAPREGHRRALSIARAIETQSIVLSVNRCGREPPVPAGPGNQYAGGSLAIGCKGEILGELGPDEGVLSVDLDIREVRRWREIFPAWKERLAR